MTFVLYFVKLFHYLNYTTFPTMSQPMCFVCLFHVFIEDEGVFQSVAWHLNLQVSESEEEGKIPCYGFF